MAIKLCNKLPDGLTIFQFKSKEKATLRKHEDSIEPDNYVNYLVQQILEIYLLTVKILIESS